MFQHDTVFYLGQERENGFSGIIAEDGFLAVLEIEEGITVDEGREKLNLIKEELIATEIHHLADLDKLIHEIIQKHNLPANVSLAVGYIKASVLYLKTIGSGVIYVKRGNEFGKIIDGEKSASGRIHEQDTYLFTTDNFVLAIGGEEKVKKLFDHKKPHEIIDEITPQLKGNNDEGIIGLFSQFHTKEETESLFVSHTNPWEKVTSVFRRLHAKAQEYSIQAGPKKKYTFIAVIIIFSILVWSIALGHTRRSDAALDKIIQSAKTEITQKLQQADESAFLNLSQSLAYIADAKQDLEKLKKEVGKRKQNDLKDISDLITKEENKITKKEEKKYDEFYDLTVDNKNAKGSKMFLSSNILSILDTTQGIIYTLSLDKKSLDKIQASSIKSAQKMSRYEDVIIFYTSDGFYKVDSNGEISKVIEKDADWGTITDLWIYNGNIYALDSVKDQIYKYLVAESGYSAKTSYFTGGLSGLKDANSLAIDSSVYVGFPDHIFKFTAGSQDEFKTSFPNSNIRITKVFTAKDLEKVYAWDKTNGSLYVLGKNGTYERELYSPVLKQITDFIVYNNNAYLLSGQKIYVMSVE